MKNEAKKWALVALLSLWGLPSFLYLIADCDGSFALALTVKALAAVSLAGCACTWGWCMKHGRLPEIRLNDEFTTENR